MIKLKDSDWASLLPGEVVKIGETAIDITPMTLETLAKVIRRLGALRSDGGGGVSEDEFLEQMIRNAPDVLETCSGLDADDIRRLPASEALKLIEAVWRVNKGSQTDLLKNFKAMIGAIKGIQTGGQ